MNCPFFYTAQDNGDSYGCDIDYCPFYKQKYHEMIKREKCESVEKSPIGKKIEKLSEVIHGQDLMYYISVSNHEMYKQIMEYARWQLKQQELAT